MGAGTITACCPGSPVSRHQEQSSSLSASWPPRERDGNIYMAVHRRSVINFAENDHAIKTNPNLHKPVSWKRGFQSWRKNAVKNQSNQNIIAHHFMASIHSSMVTGSLEYTCSITAANAMHIRFASLCTMPWKLIRKHTKHSHPATSAKGSGHPAASSKRLRSHLVALACRICQISSG